MRKYTIGILLTLLMAACGVNDPLEVVAPQVVGMYPEPGSADVEVATRVWATFDAAVDPTWAEGSFTLTDAAGATTVVDASYDASTLTVTLTPSAPLAYDTVYEAAFTVEFGTQSTVGTLAEAVGWTFTTRAAPAGQEPGGNTGGDAGGNTGGDTGGQTGGETGGEAGGTGNTGAGDPVSECSADACTFENVDLAGVSVPANATWMLANVTIDGPFEIGAGAMVHATNLVVNGKLEATGAADLLFEDTTVTGKVEIRNGGPVRLTRMAVGAHLELSGNYGPVYVSSSDVQLHLEVEDNMARVELIGNVVGTDLACTGNSTAPIGSGNSAGGSVTGQCVDL